jgi:hypothetical protein
MEVELEKKLLLWRLDLTKWVKIVPRHTDITGSLGSLVPHIMDPYGWCYPLFIHQSLGWKIPHSSMIPIKT